MARFEGCSQQLWIAEIGEIGVVELDIARALGGQVQNLGVVDGGQVGEKILHIGVGRPIDGLASAPEMEHGRRGNGEFGRPRRHRFGIGEIPGLDALGPCHFSSDGKGGDVALQIGSVGPVEARPDFAFAEADALNGGQEVARPIGAPELTVGNTPESRVFLQLDRLKDAFILDPSQLIGTDDAVLPPFPGVEQSPGPQQAAHMIGPEGWGVSLAHG